VARRCGWHWKTLAVFPHWLAARESLCAGGLLLPALCTRCEPGSRLYINCHLYYPALVPSEELKKAFKDLATWPKHKRVGMLCP
jgi:hypothetical protein